MPMVLLGFMLIIAGAIYAFYAATKFSVGSMLVGYGIVGAGALMVLLSFLQALGVIRS